MEVYGKYGTPKREVARCEDNKRESLRVRGRAAENKMSAHLPAVELRLDDDAEDGVGPTAAVVHGRGGDLSPPARRVHILHNLVLLGDDDLLGAHRDLVLRVAQLERRRVLHEQVADRLAVDLDVGDADEEVAVGRLVDAAEDLLDGQREQPGVGGVAVDGVGLARRRLPVREDRPVDPVHHRVHHAAPHRLKHVQRLGLAPVDLVERRLRPRDRFARLAKLRHAPVRRVRPPRLRVFRRTHGADAHADADALLRAPTHVKLLLHCNKLPTRNFPLESTHQKELILKKKPSS